ncbi:MAG: cytidine deaminase [Agriterribacter sp.]
MNAPIKIEPLLKKKEINFYYTVVDSIEQLTETDRLLLRAAREETANAYAPYSQFNVGAAALLKNGEIVAGSNQENASSPAGLCAERVVLSAISSIYKHADIDTIAISYHNKKNDKNNQPVAPCGICRQSLLEYQIQQNKPIRLLLAGQTGEIYIIEDVRFLLPLSFSNENM